MTATRIAVQKIGESKSGDVGVVNRIGRKTSCYFHLHFCPVPLCWCLHLLPMLSRTLCVYLSVLPRRLQGFHGFSFVRYELARSVSRVDCDVLVDQSFENFSPASSPLVVAK